MAGNPFYNKTSLLLHFDGANNSTTFTDSSPNPKTITANGNVKISTTQSKINGSSAFYDGNGDYLSIPDSVDFDLSGGIFTVATHVYPTGGTGERTICGQWTTTGNLGWIITLNAARELTFYYTTNGSTGVFSQYTAGYAVGLNTWAHIAVVLYGKILRLFIDGFIRFENRNFTASIFNSAGLFGIGAQGNGAGYYTGYIDEIVIAKDALYTEAFTPPVAAYADYQSQISGTIIESLAANSFIARAYDIDTGALVGSKTFTDTTTFDIDIVTYAKACEVKVSADYKIWKAATVYALDDKVFPLDPVAKPYYYKRIAAGTSGSTEPTWPTTAGGQCNDGAVSNAWELVERLIQPIVHGPLIPS